MDQIQDSGAKPPILIIEDDALQMRVLAHTLEREELHPICCQTGREALKVCQQSRLNVAILDLQLPDMDGLQLLRRLKAQNPDIKVIINTGYASLETAMAAVNEEAFAYVRKVEDLRELLTHVHRAYHLHLASRSQALEAEVEERTIALLKANEELKSEIVQRQRAEAALQAYSERLAKLVERRTKELQQAQEQLIRQEKLAVLGQLAGGVGHELRNPLGVISNAVYFLQITLPEINKTTQEYLDLISSRVHEAERIVSDLLGFSRVQAAAREEVALSELVTEVLERHPPPAHISVVTQLALQLPPVFVDPQQIRQVLVNLVVNAYQAMPDGGKLHLSARAEPSHVHLFLTDTGYGISQDTGQKIFEPLFTTKARGVGLGLAVSRNLVEANHGRLEVSSMEGEGSTFTLTLPIKQLPT